MADGTKIEWTDATWNPITGCSIKSPGCINCYAQTLAGTRLRNIPSRKGLTDETKNGPVFNGKLSFNEGWLDQPLRWKRPRRIFVCAHGDLFHENAPDEWIDKVFAVMALAPQHQFQVLTKRADRMRAYFAGIPGMENEPGARDAMIEGAAQALYAKLNPKEDPESISMQLAVHAPLPNVWLGVSAERQQEADERIPHLLNTPAAVRFVSAEPLIGPLDLSRLCRIPHGKTKAGIHINALKGRYCETGVSYTGEWDVNAMRRAPDIPPLKLDWVIVGGESGRNARPMHPDWARSLRDQCAAAGIPFFFKQHGEHIPCELTDLAGEDGEHWRRDANGKEFWFFDEVGKNRSELEKVRMSRVGKKASGRLLDGREHSEFPS